MIESHSNPTRNLTKIVFRLEESDRHSHAMESMWASPAGAGQLRLENIPFYVYGVSYRDVASVLVEEGLPLFQEVVERGGHSTYRISCPTKTLKRNSMSTGGHFKPLGARMNEAPTI